jgi:hypothetical protein
LPSTWCATLIHQKEKVCTLQRDLQWFLTPVPSRTAKCVKTRQSVYVLQYSHSDLIVSRRLSVPQYRASNGEMNAWKEFQGNGHWLIVVLSRNYPGGTEESHEHLDQDGWTRLVIWSENLLNTRFRSWN